MSYLFNRAISLSVLTLVMVAAIGVACGDDDDDEAPADTSPGATTSAATASIEPETLKIGVNLDLTGPLAALSEQDKLGYELAVKHINEEGGISIGNKVYEIELVVRDTRLDPNVAVANATELIRDEAIKYIFGPISDVTFNPAYAVAKENGIWAGGTLSQLIQADLSTKPLSENPNVFVYVPSTVENYRAVASVLRDLVPDAQTVAILSLDTPSGKAFADVLKQIAVEFQYDVTATDVYPQQGGEFNTIIGNVTSASPDFLWVVTSTQAVPIIKAAEEVGKAQNYMTIPMVEPEVALNTAVGGPIAHPLYGSTATPVIGPLASSPERRAFGEQVANETGQTLSLEHVGSLVRAYYQMRMLVTAIEEAGTVEDVEAVSGAMEGLEYDGPAGPAYIENHLMWTGIDLIEIKDGAVTQLCFLPDIKTPDVRECAPPES